MNKALEKINERLKRFRDQLTKADLNSKKIPEVKDSADIDDSKKMIESKHMNGKNVEQYNHKGEKIIHDRAKGVCDLSKGEKGLGDREREDMEGPQVLPEVPGETSRKKKPVTHDECGRPFGKDEDLDAKIRAKIKEKMDQKGFGEADATKHIIDRDQGDKIAQKPKKEPLLQTEVVKIDDKGQWSIEKSNYGPKGMDLYSQKDNAKRKENNTGESLADIGKNKNAKNYTTSKASMQAASEATTAKEQKVKTIASTKIYNDEEKAAFIKQREKASKS